MHLKTLIEISSCSTARLRFLRLQDVEVSHMQLLSPESCIFESVTGKAASCSSDHMPRAADFVRQGKGKNEVA